VAAEDIVLVDDDRVIQKMVGGFLERRGYHVRKASDGIEALRFVRDRIPDLVITDVRMPELNGIELTSRLRAHHRTAAVPILMFSELGSAHDALAGYAAGADDYLPKPFELEILEAKVQSLLRRSAGDSAKVNRGKVILFAHAKGGVGTTCLAVNTAILLAACGLSSCGATASAAQPARNENSAAKYMTRSGRGLKPDALSSRAKRARTHR